MTSGGNKTEWLGGFQLGDNFFEILLTALVRVQKRECHICSMFTDLAIMFLVFL